jgi:GMP synthase (glutamine-hydrolysing)
MGSWFLLQHVPFEGPGAIAHAAVAAGVELVPVHLHAGDQLPAIEDVEGLVAMGGPMGALDDDPHAFLAAERHLLAAAAHRDLPVLGVCLGAQLLATSLGAPLYRLGQREQSVGFARLTAAGLADPVLGVPGREGVLTTVDPELIEVVHWHRDTFDLPPGAVRLARTGSTPNQAFRVGTRAYGLQFHVEADPEWGDDVRAHWPADIPLRDEDLVRVSQSGRPILDAFFALALGRSQAP